MINSCDNYLDTYRTASRLLHLFSQAFLENWAALSGRLCRYAPADFNAAEIRPNSPPGVDRRELLGGQATRLQRGQRAPTGPQRARRSEDRLVQC
jgi:hypothetical protein